MAYGRRTVVFFEIVQPLCTREYGASPCTARVGVTGARKCFNTLGTCQDQENYEAGELVLRFARDDDRVALDYGPVIACLDDVRTSPGRINVAGMEDSAAAFGRRETLTVTMRDFKWADLYVDKYRLERTFVPGPAIAGYAMPFATFPTFGSRARVLPESAIAVGDFLGYDDPAIAPYNRGTFWSRWIARNPYYAAMSCRVREGYEGDALENMRVRHYVMERVEGPNDGAVTITATDVFSRIEARKALAPFPSTGDLTADITGSPGTFAVTPGTGALTPREGGYSTITAVTQGYVAIGAREIIKVTRSGDTFTVVGRGQLGTTQIDHKDGDSVQLVISFESQLSHDIAYALITGYTEVGASRIDKPSWDTLAATVTELFTSHIAEPTPVDQLLAELEMQAGFTLWPEVSTGMIRYAALRSGGASPIVTDEGWIIGTPQVRRRDDRRVSQVIVHYVKRNPLSELEDSTSYAARVITPGPGASPFGSEEVRRVYSRWITTGGQNTAVKCGERIFAMYENPPIEAKFAIDASRAGQLEEARYFELRTAEVQDDVGDVRPVVMTPVSIRRGENTEDVEAMSVRFSGDAEDGVRRVFIDTDEFNVNLRDLHDTQYAAPVGDEEVEFIVVSGTTIGSTSTSTAAVKRGVWPGGMVPKLINQGRILGKGGAGANGRKGSVGAAFAGLNGAPGGPALDASDGLLEVDNTDGEIWGGGGGGASGASNWYSFFIVGLHWHGAQPSGGGGEGATSNPQGGGNGASGIEALTDNVVNSTGGAAGTATAGGTKGIGHTHGGNTGGDGGDGGGPGLAGQAGAASAVVDCSNGCATAAGGTGGAPGAYIIGNANVTWSGTGDRRGTVS